MDDAPDSDELYMEIVRIAGAREAHARPDNDSATKPGKSSGPSPAGFRRR